MSVPEEIAESEPHGLRAIAFEAVLAFATVTLWPIPGAPRQASVEQRARAMLFLPIAGLTLGVALALIDHSLVGLASPLSRSAIVIAISILAGGAIGPVGLAHAIGELRAGSRPSWTGLTEIGPIGVLSVLVFVGSEIWLLGTIVRPPARAEALMLATMLSRWAIVPVGYGLKPLERRGLGVPWEGGIRFREFAGSSVLAFGIAMGLYNVVGIAAIVVMAFAILALRLLFSRRLGGADGYALAAGAAICELATFALMAALRF